MRKHFFGLRYRDNKPIYFDHLGTQFQTAGLLLTGKNGHAILAFLPDEISYKNIIQKKLSVDEWISVLKQLDNPEYFITKPDGNIVKAIVRKNQRMIGANLQWKIYRRDNYKCKYCKRDDVPLTIDHKEPVELGGTDDEDNLVTSCRACNKRKGDMPYAEWLKQR